MSYQVLARKYRPPVFREMVGQEHVLKALINALDQNRLHHAYLFTGTRGVGKTSIARILAKCLNCEGGVTSEPCDQCGSCLEISEGRFVDLIEVDAASRTKVEDTRELLDNVQYAPSKGRFKVYLIDEVHMLSGHSFNALLKTLEEPPPHVKFLLATTDPQKLPVTILSRCLQFNLKNMSPERIVEHLQQVLGAEGVPFEESALWQLGRSADGSMRDALSLTDQAIGFGEGKITEADVNAMLGSIDRSYILDMVRALASGDGAALLARIDDMAEHSPDYEQALAELISLLHRLAIAQVVPESIDNTFGDRETLLALAAELSGDDVQLFYQMAILGRRDLPLAPDPRAGFEMVLLRLLAFKPESSSGKLAKPPVSQAGEGDTASKPNTPEGNRQSDDSSSLAGNNPEGNGQKKKQLQTSSEKPIIGSANKEIQSTVVSTSEVTETRTGPDSNGSDVASKHAPKITRSETRELENHQPLSLTKSNSNGAGPRDINSNPPALNELASGEWNTLVAQLNVGGVVGNTLNHCQCIASSDGVVQLRVDQEFATLYDASHQQRIAQSLTEFFGYDVEVSIQVGEVDDETPAAAAQRAKAERQQQALSAMQADPLVQDVIQTFSATLQEDSVVPIDH